LNAPVAAPEPERYSNELIERDPELHSLSFHSTHTLWNKPQTLFIHAKSFEKPPAKQLTFFEASHVHYTSLERDIVLSSRLGL
jgi:hypothetical protein